MAGDDDAVDDEGKTLAEGDPSGPPVKVATKKEREKEPAKPKKRSVIQDLADPEIWNTDAVKKARRERWYGGKE